MRRLFADSFYWIAFLDRSDQWHSRVQREAARLTTAQIVTTEEVFVEVLAAFRDAPHRREIAVKAVREIPQHPRVEVIPQSHESFLAGLELYATRRDKQYSLTDCISMVAMRRRGIVEVLTHDEHFEQEGFQRIFRD